MRISEKSSPDGRAPAAPAERTGLSTPAERTGLSAPASRRLPVPPRERRPALAALAVLLVLGGALATTLLVLRAGDRVSAIRIVRQVGAGQRVPLEAMEEVLIADTGVDYVAWRHRAEVAKTFARVTLLPGTLLTERMVTRASEELGPGKAIVGLALKAGQAPAGLTAGDRVQVIHAPPADRGDAPGRVLVRNALVHEVGEPGRSGSGGPVSIVVDAAVAPTVARHASSGEIALAALPGAG